jgi:ElaA protein
MSLSCKAKPFSELTVHELHDVLRLRTDVFVVEQGCAYPEIDGRDPFCTHILGTDPSGSLIACARIVPPETDGPPHIGRVVVHRDHRGRGYARQLMNFTLDVLGTLYGSLHSELAAQSHLKGFYESLGYVQHGAEYLWDGILHIDMVKLDRITSPG